MSNHMSVIARERGGLGALYWLLLLLLEDALGCGSFGCRFAAEGQLFFCFFFFFFFLYCLVEWLVVWYLR